MLQQFTSARTATSTQFITVQSDVRNQLAACEPDVNGIKYTDASWYVLTRSLSRQFYWREAQKPRDERQVKVPLWAPDL
jgi:hypothetical protein